MRRSSSLLALRGLVALALGLGVLGEPAAAETPIGTPALVADTNAGGVLRLSPAELEQMKLSLIASKPDPATATLLSFLVPGSGEAYLGSLDRTALIWGGYLASFAAWRLLVPANLTTSPGGPRVADVGIGGTFLLFGVVSAVDTFRLVAERRAATDRALERLELRPQAMNPGP